MGILKSLTAKSVDWAMKNVSTSTLDFARNNLPLAVKRRLARLVTTEIELNDEIAISKNGHKFVVIKEPVFVQVRYEGTYEKDLSSATEQLISEGDTVIDVGANFGWYSILMANSVGSKGRVFSYEPNEAIFPTLQQNIKLNNFEDRIKLTKCGIGEKKELAFLAADDSESAIGYFDKSLTEAGQGHSSKGIQIHALDELMAKNINKISFIKVDVEGFEPFVIRGAKKIFSADNPPAMLMEFNIEAIERQNLDVAQFITELEALDAIIVKTNHGKLQVIDHIPKSNENLFFLPKRGKFKSNISSLKK